MAGPDYASYTPLVLFTASRPYWDFDGYNVIAVNNPLTSLADDIAMTKRVIDNQKGPIVDVGHSYGGAVITGAAYNNTNVKALVYVAAFAPDSNETLGILLDKFWTFSPPWSNCT